VGVQYFCGGVTHDPGVNFLYPQQTVQECRATAYDPVCGRIIGQIDSAFQPVQQRGDTSLGGGIYGIFPAYHTGIISGIQNVPGFA
jgi:hypothetical protein